jgi:ABC-type polysaccharide/polyol phosphate export permease
MAIDAPAGAELPLLMRSSERRPLFSEAADELRALRRHHELLRYMVSNALRTTYSGTFFGYLWWLLDPMLYTAVYVLMFDVILRRGGQNFALYIATSVLAWKYFSSATRNGIGLTEAKAHLMRQVAFPRSVLPLAAALAESVRFLFGLVALLVFAAFFGIFPAASFPEVLAVAAVQLVFTLGVSYLLSALNVLFRDTYQLTQYVFQIWFYLSPGLYALAYVPQRFKSWYMLNPFATLLPAYHGLILYHQSPDFGALAEVAAGSLAVLVLGFLSFVRLQPLFAKLQ